MRGKIAAQHKGAALGSDGIVQRADDVVINQLRIGDVFGERVAVDSHTIAVELIAELRHQRAQSTSVIKILH